VRPLAVFLPALEIDHGTGRRVLPRAAEPDVGRRDAGANTPEQPTAGAGLGAAFDPAPLLAPVGDESITAEIVPDVEGSPAIT
jgi:hypothetical protein